MKKHIVTLKLNDELSERLEIYVSDKLKGIPNYSKVTAIYEIMNAMLPKMNGNISTVAVDENVEDDDYTQVDNATIDELIKKHAPTEFGEI